MPGSTITYAEAPLSASAAVQPFQYPSTVRDALSPKSYTNAPVLQWQSDSVLWLAQTLNGSDNPILMIDKTCDLGATWSGAVNAGSYRGTTLLSTARGMVATGWVQGHTSATTMALANGVITP